MVYTPKEVKRTNITLSILMTDYVVTCIAHIHGDDQSFSQTSYTFEAIIDGKVIPLKFNIDRVMVQDMCAIMGLDPIEELANIAVTEIKNELIEIILSKEME